LPSPREVIASRVPAARRRTLLAALLGGAALIACRDATYGTAPRIPNLPSSVFMVVETAVGNDSMMTVGVRLVGLDTPAVASLTADISYDTTRLRYRFDESPQDGAMRAMSATRGRVSIAVAHATGLTHNVAARLAFIASDTTAYQTLRLTVRELHRIDASDARRTLTVVPTATRARTGTP
jgi:hypothetical protein